jgi:hypothetical protein
MAVDVVLIVLIARLPDNYGAWFHGTQLRLNAEQAVVLSS